MASIGGYIVVKSIPWIFQNPDMPRSAVQMVNMLSLPLSIAVIIHFLARLEFLNVRFEIKIGCIYIR